MDEFVNNLEPLIIALVIILVLFVALVAWIKYDNGKVDKNGKSTPKAANKEKRQDLKNPKTVQNNTKAKDTEHSKGNVKTVQGRTTSLTNEKDDGPAEQNKETQEKDLNGYQENADKPEQKVSQEKMEIKQNSSNETIMYASLPRSTGDEIYFSDLTEKKDEDSFFEISISQNNGNATFKPLEFMKIRNYDDAMIAMSTEGVKPNIASEVIGIEPGSAHLEGNDWIIDKQANIKLA